MKKTIWNVIETITALTSIGAICSCEYQKTKDEKNMNLIKTLDSVYVVSSLTLLGMGLVDVLEDHKNIKTLLNQEEKESL